MNDKRKTKAQLIADLADLRHRVASLETTEARHKQTEEELYRSRQMLQLVLDTIPQRVFWKDRNFSYIGCNKPFAKDAGLHEPNEIVGKDDFELGWKEVANLYRDDDTTVMTTGTPKLNFEEPQTTSSGDQLWLRTSKVPLRDRDDNVIGILGTYEDITERKRIENALRYERNLLRTLIDNLPDAIYVKDESCRKTIANRADTRNMGLQSEAEAVGKDDYASYPKEVADKFFADDQSVIQSGQSVLNREEYFFDPMGQRHWLSTSKVPLRDAHGQIVGLIGIGRDITERKRAEEALRYERNLLRTLIDNLPDAVYVKDMNCRKTIANVRDVHVTGLQSEADVLNKTDFDFYPVDVASAYYANDQFVIQTGKPVLNKEDSHSDKEGRKHWFSTTKLPLCDDQGRIIGLLGVGRDITEQKRAEEALRKEKALLDALMDNIPDSIYFKDRHCRIVRINRKMMRNLKLDDTSQGVGKTDVELFGAEFGQKTMASDETLMATGESVEGLVESRKLENGQVNWTLTTKVPLRDDTGQIVGLVGITKEINELMKVQQEREHERNLLRAVVENMPDLFYFKDVEGRYLLNNRAHLRSIGVEHSEEVLGKTSESFNPPELSKQYTEDELQIVRTGQGLLEREELALHRDTGEQRWHLTSKIPLKDSQGNILGIVGISHDITEQKRAMAEREKLIHELQEALADVKTLSGLVPICANCKKIRDDKGYWTQIEACIQARTPAHFSHGICPDCAKILYPEYKPREKR